MNILQIKNLYFAYEKQNNLEDISFNLNDGEILCVLGPNGCGKSTLLDCLLGINKISQGKIILDNKDIKKYKASEVAKYISYVPQSHNKSFPYTVKDIILMGRTHTFGLLSTPTYTDFMELDQALTKIGIQNLKDRPYTALSGGELQLVLIARALYQNARIILMDEPTSHLDFYYENKVLNIVGQLVKENNISVIMATHYLNHPLYFENEGIKTRVAMMNNKKIVHMGSPSKVITEKNLKDVYKINTFINEFTYNEKIYRQVVTTS